MLVAEQGLFRAGLRSLLERTCEFCTIEETGTGLDLTPGTAVLAADLLVLDWAVPNFPAAEVLQSLCAAAPVVVLWDERERPDHQALHDSGVWKSIDKRLGATPLLDAVGDVTRRAHNVAPVSAVSNVQRCSNTQRFRLTRREGEILEAVASAFPNREIAERLAITEDTVKRHLTSIFDKLGVSNRVELTLFAVHHGLLDGAAPPEKPRTPSRTLRTSRRLLPWRRPLLGTR